MGGGARSSIGKMSGATNALEHRRRLNSVSLAAGPATTHKCEQHSSCEAGAWASLFESWDGCSQAPARGSCLPPPCRPPAPTVFILATRRWRSASRSSCLGASGFWCAGWTRFRPSEWRAGSRCLLGTTDSAWGRACAGSCRAAGSVAGSFWLPNDLRALARSGLGCQDDRRDRLDVGAGSTGASPWTSAPVKAAIRHSPLMGGTSEACRAPAPPLAGLWDGRGGVA